MRTVSLSGQGPMTNLPNTPPTPSRILGDGDIDRKARWERNDEYYKVVLEFRERWRLIKCKDDRQYIVQKRSSKRPNVGVWIAKSHNTTKAGLILSCSRLDLLHDIDIIEQLLLLPARPNLEAQNV